MDMDTNRAREATALLDRMSMDDMRDLKDEELRKLRLLAEHWRNVVATEMCKRCGYVF